MKKAIVPYLILIFVAGCASRNPAPVSQVPEERSKEITQVKRPLKLPPAKRAALAGKRNQVFWRLIGMDQVTLQVQSLGSKPQTLSVPLNQEIFYHSLPSGDWQIQGFKVQDKNYTALSTAQKPQFKVFRNSYSYAGSLVIHCPKVGQEYFDELKLMKFFNRYTFSTGNQLCEMVVGNDYDHVKDAWKGPKHAKGVKLLLGL